MPSLYIRVQGPQTAFLSEGAKDIDKLGVPGTCFPGDILKLGS